MNLRWKRGEFWYCRQLVASHGDDSVGHLPAPVAYYLRLQASQAYRDGEMEISARLSTSAMAISESADNHHAPGWDNALEVLTPEGVEIGSLEDTGTCTKPAGADRVERTVARTRRPRRRGGDN